MNLLLSEPLPLRTSRELGDFADDQVLPQRFGDLRHTRFPLIKLSDSVWFAADHAMRITAVYVDDEATAGYDVQLQGDDVGNSWTVVRLAAPAPPDAKISASGVGRLDPVTGALIENPADLIEFVFTLGGRSETFPLLRAEAAAAGIVLAGSLDRKQSIRAWVDEIAYSCGAIWTPADAVLYPTTTIRGQVTALDRFAASSVDVSSGLADTADILHVSYDWNAATSRPRQFVELTASPQRFGGIVVEVQMLWLRSSANAETIGRRMLQRMAGVRYDVTYETDQTDLRPCHWSRLTSHPSWPIPGADPSLMILSVDVDTEARQCTVVAEHVASTPTVTVTAHSVALPETTSAAVELAIKNGIVTMIVTDSDGKPIKDAFVSLDHGAAKKTSELGAVQFTVTPATPPRKHLLEIDAPGMSPLLLDVYL